jgi:bacterial/archaeal transporter family protein
MAWPSWKTLMLLSIAAWGLWGFLGKIALERIGWGPAFALLAISDLVVLLIIKPQSFLLHANTNYLLGLGMAVAGTLGGICFYMALERGPATVVVPGTALYIVVAAVLAFMFLGETVTVNRILGVGLGLAAIYFLSKG